LLNYADALSRTLNSDRWEALGFAAEAAWVTGKWGHLRNLLLSSPEPSVQGSINFNVGIANALLSLQSGAKDDFNSTITILRESVRKTLSTTSTASLQTCHEQLLRFHVLYELRIISGFGDTVLSNLKEILPVLDRRLDILGVYTSDKQYVLGIRRAAMSLSKYV
jgi:serine/threonine-protein kinase ATR